MGGILAALHRMGDELNRQRRHLAHGGDLVALHDGGECVARTDPRQTLHRRVRGHRGRRIRTRYGARYPARYGPRYRTGCGTRTGGHRRRRRRLRLDEHRDRGQAVRIHQMAGRRAGIADGLRPLDGQLESGRQLTGAKARQSGRSHILRRSLAHPAHAIGLDRGCKL